MLERKDVKMSRQCRLPADGGRTRYAALGATGLDVCTGSYVALSISSSTFEKHKIL